MTTACCPQAPLALPAAVPSGWLSLLGRAWGHWRARVHLRATQRALDGLDDRTRRDLGLAERGAPTRAERLWELDRGSW